MEWIEENIGKEAYINCPSWGIIRALRPYIGKDGKRLTIIKRTKSGLIYCKLEKGHFSINQKALTVTS